MKPKIIMKLKEEANLSTIGHVVDETRNLEMAHNLARYARSG
jgi:hypothetical protein